MAGEDPAYLAFVRAQPCAVGHCHPGGVPHHTGPKGLSQRSHDHDAIPMCDQHHKERHALSGFFKGWKKAHLKAWETDWVELTRSAHTEDVF